MLKDAHAANNSACSLADLAQSAFNATYILSFGIDDGKTSPEQAERVEQKLRGMLLSLEQRLADLKTAIG